MDELDKIDRDYDALIACADAYVYGVVGILVLLLLAAVVALLVF